LISFDGSAGSALRPIGRPFAGDLQPQSSESGSPG
jgi:hypothetical protein